MRGLQAKHYSHTICTPASSSIAFLCLTRCLICMFCASVSVSFVWCVGVLQIPVPQNRMTPLKTAWMQLYTPITDNLKLDMRMNLKTKKVRLQRMSEAWGQRTGSATAVQRHMCVCLLSLL